MVTNTHSPNVLLVSSNDAARSQVSRMIETRRRCQVECESDVARAIKRARSGHHSMALFHVDDMDGVVQAARFLYETNADSTPVPTVVLNEQSSVDVSLHFVRMGAVECLHLNDISRLSLLLDMITARHRVATPSDSPVDNSPTLGLDDEYEGYLSPKMRQLMEQVMLVAPLETTVMVTGETGVGKTRLARCIHERSRRASKEFLTVNCGALSATLIESELFGHVRGAFTSADSDHEGKFDRANGGTLLLDDIDAMSLDVQAKMLRAVDERVFEPLGSNRTRAMNARLIVATNKSLEEETRERRFREDLYYRLNVVSIHLPPLRERRGEIRPLAEQFMTKFSADQGIPAPGFEPAAMRALEGYDWPGNVRELRNVIERSVILSRGQAIRADALPEKVAAGHSDPIVSRSIENCEGNQLAAARENAEHCRLQEALRSAGNNRSVAAKTLGISRTALYRKLNKYAMV